jgi:hypothetical protein
LIADVVGFSRHMERDESAAFGRLREIRERIFGGSLPRQKSPGPRVCTHFAPEEDASAR